MSAYCIVSNTTADNNHALRQIRVVFKGNIADSSQLIFHRVGRSVAVGRRAPESKS